MWDISELVLMTTVSPIVYPLFPPAAGLWMMLWTIFLVLFGFCDSVCGAYCFPGGSGDAEDVDGTGDNDDDNGLVPTITAVYILLGSRPDDDDSDNMELENL